jgi:hypothetical protein
MQKLLNKYAFFIPVLLLLIFCLIELWFFIFTPYSYFYSRGVNFPNVDYETTTYGDLTPEDIFITKQPRKARYVTDKYGSRNIDIPSSVDILILGESFGTGAGVSHEHTPAVQLSELTGLSSIVAPPVYDPLKSSNIFEKAVYTIRHSDPVKPKVILMIYIDKFLWDTYGELDVQKMIKNSEKKTYDISFFQKISLFHIRAQNYLFNNSPITIFSRKFKTYLKTSLKRSLNYFSLYQMGDNKKYYQNGSEIIGFRPLPNEMDISRIKEKSYYQIQNIANSHKQLYEFGLQKNITIIPLIVPEKSLAYFNQINKTDYYSEFPGAILEDIIKSYSLPVVSVYPEFLEAINNQFNKNGEPVYWGDDTHWNALGIRISMMKVKELIKTLKI